MKPTYITTSIAYVNAEPHIGFLFELVAADVIARSAKLKGEEVFFLTGTDEHGLKVAKAAKAADKQPQEFVDEISGKFQELTKQFNVETDYFVRTSNPDHKKFVQEKWQQLQTAGVLKKKSYSGLYCAGCEAFKTASEITGGKCLVHETELEKVEEENWFLVIDPVTKEKIKAWVNEAVFPETRRQEVINIIDSGAYDEVSVSRPKAKNAWGVEVPGDDEQVMYVWVDALFNYISALKINNKEDLWPADVQVIGKDILKFHAIIWPALLLATGYELPKKLLVHGFINVDGKKLSKSLGHIVYPKELLDRYGPEAARYLLFRQLSFYDDSNFNWEDFDNIYNGELANGLGNLLTRVVSLLRKFGGDEEGLKKIKQLINKLSESNIEDLDFLVRERPLFANHVDKVIDLSDDANLWVTSNQPWTWIDTTARVGDEKILEFLKNTHLLAISHHLRPFMPEISEAILRQLTELDPKPLFPRLEK